MADTNQLSYRQLPLEKKKKPNELIIVRSVHTEALLYLFFGCKSF